MNATRPLPLLAAALALAAAPALARRRPYSQTVFFGDSLTDSGYFRRRWCRRCGRRRVTRPLHHQPGPGLVQYLADYYGTRAAGQRHDQGGTNYAVGGARVGTDTAGALGPMPSLATQVDALPGRNGGRADPERAVHGLGRRQRPVRGRRPNRRRPTTIIGGAVTAQVGLVGTLQSAGARYILVPTMPDLGLTPASRAGGAAAHGGQGTQLANSLQQRAVRRPGRGRPAGDPAGHLPLPAAKSSPARRTYGFSNVTGTACQPQITAQLADLQPGQLRRRPSAPTPMRSPTACIRPARAHKIIADYAVSVLEGPRQIAVLPHSAAMVGRARADASPHIAWPAAGRATACAGGPTCAATTSATTTATVRTTASARRRPAASGLDQRQPRSTAPSPATAAGQSTGASAAASFDQTDTTLGGFVGWHGDSAWVNAQLSYTWLELRHRARRALGPATRMHSGSADGDNLAVALRAPAGTSARRARHGPVLSLVSQHIDVDGYRRGPADACRPRWPTRPGHRFADRQRRLAGQLRRSTSTSRPYARLTWDREFEDAAGRSVRAAAVDAGHRCRTRCRACALDHDYGTLMLGARTQLFGLRRQHRRQPDGRPEGRQPTAHACS